MDEIDRKLLAILQEDVTLSIAQMAERVVLSPTPSVVAGALRCRADDSRRARRLRAFG